MAEMVGIDTGGTFTDLVSLNDDGSIRVAKHPSTPESPTRAFVGVLEKSNVPREEIRRIVHGVTIATNAVIQRQGARVVYITTQGFEDVPFIQRINRKKAYDLQWMKPRPVVRRRDCIGVDERMNQKGEVVRDLDRESLERLGERIREEHAKDPIEAIAVCLLFSYLNPAHELKVAEYLGDILPGVPVSLSHQVAPVWREYERSSTTLADAFVKPLTRSYSDHLQKALDDLDVKHPCYFLKSNGGMTRVDNVGQRPVDILLSGLAGGIVGGKYFASQAGIANAITVDMGGTSADVGVIRDGEQQFTTEFEIEWGLPVAIPVIEVQTLGAGGGSIAWIDKGGMLNVGPKSAGAKPGPACYGTGGTEPTVTDANLVLGRLNPEYFLGGEVPLDPSLAEEAVRRLAEKMGMDLYEAASAIVNIADENMSNAIRLTTIERGLDPRDFSLVAFGGAGPLHGVGIAQKLGIPKVLVPPHPGLCSAFGAAMSELRVEKVRTLAARDEDVSEAFLLDRLREMGDEARDELSMEGREAELRETYSLSLRYFEQNYEQDVVYDPEKGLDDAYRQFHQKHQDFVGYHFPEETIEIVHLKVSLTEVAEERPVRMAVDVSEAEMSGTRTVWESPERSVEAAIYRRDRLPVGTALEGPAIVEEMDSTTYIPSGARFEVHPSYNLIIHLTGV